MRVFLPFDREEKMRRPYKYLLGEIPEVCRTAVFYDKMDNTFRTNKAQIDKSTTNTNLIIESLTYTIIKLENTKVKERISKATRDRRRISCKVTTPRLTTAYSTIMGKPEDNGKVSSKCLKKLTN